MLQTQFQLSNETKLPSQLAAQFRYPILSIVIFLRPWFFSLRSPSLLLKRLLWVQLLILPVCLHKHTKSSLGHLWSLSSLCWNSHREPLDWLFSPPLGAQKQSHTPATWLHLYQLFHSNLEASIVPTGSFLAIFQESNLRSFPGKTATNRTTNQGTRLLLVGFC